jgi:RimJ/RimL family protein N-acetyltransferase
MLLHGAKIILRPMSPEEVPPFYHWATESDNAKWWYGEMQGDTPPSYEKFLEDWKPHYFIDDEPEKGRCFVIEVQGKAVGQVNYNQIDRSDDSVELDILIADDENTGRGYGTDALKTLCRYLFDEMGIRTCFVEVIKDNPRAIRSYQKVGFTITNEFVDMGIECYHLEYHNPE